MPKPPNVLIILTDQQRWDAVGYRQAWIKTPNLDRLASQSIDCTAAFAQSPQCQPSRACILTGRYPTAHRMWWNAIDLPTKEKTIANYFAGIGHRTAYFGKIHISEKQGEQKLTAHFGFQTQFLSSDWIKTYRVASSEYSKLMRNKGWYGRLHHRQSQHDEIITDKAIEFITSNKPFFAMVGFNGPHPPYAAPAPYHILYADREFSAPVDRRHNNGDMLEAEDWQNIKRFYYSNISWLDENIGRILAVVDDNTIVVYTSDHGDILGDHGLFSKGMYAYDGVIRVPLLVKIPRLLPIQYAHFVQHIDLLPTLLELFSIPAPLAVQGKSLLNGFKTNMPVNEYVLSMIGWRPRLRMVRTAEYKYWLHGDYHERLFDLHADPDENDSLVGTGLNSELILGIMRFKLLRALIAAEDPSPRPFTSNIIPNMARG